jgi:hypothetical protein
MLAVVALAASTFLAQTGYRIQPVDDTPRDRTFQSFVDKLNKAAVKRDVKAFKKLCADDIITGTGRKKDPEEKGWNAFVKRWRPADGDTALWETITDLISLGSVRMHPRLFVAPYLVWKFPDNVDPRRFLVLTRDQVVLRTAPDRESKGLAVLSFDLVEKLDEPGASPQWTRIRINGREGYVPSSMLRSSLTPRAQFAQGPEGWRLVALEVPATNP